MGNNAKTKLKASWCYYYKIDVWPWSYLRLKEWVVFTIVYDNLYLCCQSITQLSNSPQQEVCACLFIPMIGKK